MIGKTIGHYEVIDKIGEGGMGAVYKAEDTTLHRLVALKTLSGHLADNEEARERFVREAQAASSLNHPNITTIYEFLEEEDQRLICMEYVEGKTLRDLVASGRVSVKKAVDIILQTAEALEAAHEEGILHRDIKSANIMVNEKGRVKVMDFGLAHLEERSQLTRTGTTMGTLAYSSPEQIMGNPVDKRSEIFSLGVVFYELLTGQLPFKGSSEAEIVYAISNIKPEPLSVHREEEPNLPEAIVARMLERDQALRYQDCGELIEDLKIVQAELETPSAQIPRWAREVRATGRRVAALRFVAVVAVCVVVVALAATAGFLLTNRGPSLASDKILMAVFENETGDPAHDLVGKIMADYLVRGLQQIPFIEVLDPRITLSSLQIDQSGSGYVESVRALAEENEAGTIISGAYYLQGDSLKFQAQVTETRTGNLLQTLDPVSSAVANPLEGAGLLQQRVMASIATLFSEDLAPLVQVASQPTNYEAYREYVTGVERNTKGEYTAAFGHFSRALALDSTFVPAAVGAAIVLMNVGQRAEADSIAASLNNSRERLTEAERHVLDWLQAKLRGDRAGAYRAARKAYDLAPNSSDLAWFAGVAAAMCNRPREAVEILTSVDPTKGFFKTWPPYWGWLTEAYHMLGEYEKELETARRGQKQFPGHVSTFGDELQALAALGRVDEVNRLLDAELPLPTQRSAWVIAASELRVHDHPEAATQILDRMIEWYEARPAEEKLTEEYRSDLAESLYLAKRWEESRALFEVLAAQDPENLTYQTCLGCLAARRGDRKEALRISDMFAKIDLPYRDGLETLRRAWIAAHLGDKEEAVSLLREAYRQGRYYSSRFYRDIDFEPLLDFPPFLEFIRPKG